MDKIVGVLGGGQLGRMLTEAANDYNIKVVTLDAAHAPAKQVNAHSEHLAGSFTDPDSIRALAKKCDVLTVEIEHVNTEILEEVSTEVEVQPHWRTIRVIQDKYNQKNHLLDRHIATAQSIPLSKTPSEEELEKIAKQLGYPLMLKSRTDAYDGRGNFVIKSRNDIQVALQTLGKKPLYAEKWANFVMELAVMVVKTKNENDTDWKSATLAFDVVETVHEDSICKLVYCPARSVTGDTATKAQELARRAVATFWGKGVFGVEMFLLQDGEILINEIAPRPHNSGHHTIEACSISQYDAHLRAILGIPIPPEDLDARFVAIMLNILGGATKEAHLQVARRALTIPRARIHLYGKGDGRPGRKMGHITLTGASMNQVQRDIQPLVELVDTLRAQRGLPPTPSTTLTIPNRAFMGSTPLPTPMAPILPTLRTELVAITMGSKSDMHVLLPGIELLRQNGIRTSVHITSAHRTPELMEQFASGLASQGTKVVIAAAGGAAHLPGMIASHTHIPVIGVPIKGSVLDGVDSLHSIVQMPRGCPVATVGINNGMNAAILAMKILGTGDEKVAEKMLRFMRDMNEEVHRDNARLQEIGPEEMVREMREKSGR